MSQTLLESDYLLINLSKFNKKTSPTDEPGQGEEASGEPASQGTDKPTKRGGNGTSKPRAKKVDWSKERESRFGTGGEPDNAFWEEFFTTEFKDPNVAKALLGIDKLRDDILLLGFTKQKNALLAFLHLNYIQKNVIQAGLLTKGAYMAVRNTYAKKLIAASELTAINDYNIVFCVDLFRKTPTEIQEYLKAQSLILKPNVRVYTEDTQDLNKSIFLTAGDKATNKPSATLKKLSVINKAISSAGDGDIDISSEDTGAEETSKANETESKSANMYGLLPSLTTKEATMVTMQYLFMSTAAKAAKQALDKAVKATQLPSSDKLQAALSVLAPKLSTLRVDKNQIANFAEELYNKYITFK